LFDDLLENKGFCRIQIGVMIDNDIALRFAKSLGFEVEGIMRNFGSPGASCALMSRISDNGIHATSRTPAPIP
jgi:RimJ/RimL family protein N-acetyltransferase